MAVISDFRVNPRGFEEICKSAGMQAELDALASSICDDCNNAFNSTEHGAGSTDRIGNAYNHDIKTLDHTAIGRVSTWSQAGRGYENKYHTLAGHATGA